METGNRKNLIEKVFGGTKDPFEHLTQRAGVPTHNARSIGEICWDSSNEDYYIATDVAGTWVKINA